MPQVDTPGMQLRIFCICGQKMKVSSTMFGRPGKCIACRQKIRIPRMDEIPPDVTAIYLKDFPEFLRKPKVSQKFSEVDRLQADAEADTGDDGEDVSLGDAASDGPALPLETLEPLQILCSLEEKVQRQIEKAKRSGAQGAGDRTTLIRYRTLIRNARSAFDDRLRDRLVEATEQLSGVRESIARANMAMRVGEMTYEAYQEKVRPLRQQRDRLERRLQNLRGWLVTSDPALAGGYVEVRLEDVPVSPVDVSFPVEPRQQHSLLDVHVEALRAAMNERAAAERKLAEWQRIERERALPAGEIETGRRESEAIRQRAGANVAFVRARLEQVVQDCEQDNKGIRSFLDSLRGRIQSGEMDANTFKNTETRLLAAQNDTVNARELARRALAANSPADVPRPSSTLMQRLAAAELGATSGVGLDSWFAWAAAMLMLCAIAVPVARQQLAGNLAIAPGLSFGLFASAAVLAMIALVPRRPLRAGMLNVAWVVQCVAGAAYLHETWFGASSMGIALRADPTWFTSPGLILLVLCGMVSGLAASVSVLAVRELRRAPAIAAGVILIVLSLLLTDVFGVLTARPTLQEPAFKASNVYPGEYDVQIELGNGGWRALQLGGDPRMSVSPATFLLQRRVGQDSWEDLTLKQLVRGAGSKAGGFSNSFPNGLLQGGETFKAGYHLPPGSYRVEIAMPRTPDIARARNFTLAELDGTTTSQPEVPVMETPPAPPATAKEEPVAEDAANSEESIEAEPVATAKGTEPGLSAVSNTATETAGTTVEMQGVINAAGRDPRFIVILTQPGAAPKRSNVSLGQVVYGNWKAAEFNPGPQTLTLSDGHRLLVLERRVATVLDAGGAPADTTPAQ